MDRVIAKIAILLLEVALFLGCTCASNSYAIPTAMAAEPAKLAVAPIKVHPEFVTPKGLRPRVDFWKAVFTRYGRDQVLIHHRRYPQAIFKVLDFSEAAARLSDAEYEKFKKRVVDARVDELEAAVNRFARGIPASTGIDQQVADAMAKVPGGVERFRMAPDEKIVRAQTGIKEKYRDAIVRSGRYLPTIERIFQEEFQLPVELTRLPFVESSFNYQAYSAVGAAGIWQLMPRTGKLYLTVNKIIDERRDVVESSRAAARYLADAYTRLGTWPLTVTSYNHGVAGVMRKMEKAGTNDIVQLVESAPTDRAFGFASENFFPELLAAIEVYNSYDSLFPGLVKEPSLRIAQVRLSKPISIGFVIRQLGVPEADLRQMNYALSSGVWSGRIKMPAGYVLKIPAELHSKVGRLNQHETGELTIASSSSVVSGGTVYRVRKGDTLVGLAKRFGVTTSRIKELNEIGGSGIRVGQSLVIRKENATKEEQPRKTEPANFSSHEQNLHKQKSYRVRKGDTLWSISKKLGVTQSELRSYNGLRKNGVKAGQTLLVP